MADNRQPGAPGVDPRQQRHEAHAASTYKSFLKGLMELGSLSEGDAECAAVSVLAALERRIYGQEAKSLESQLPAKLRELLQTVPHHEGKPTEKFGREGLIEHVASDLKRDPSEIEPLVRSVFAAVRAQITEGEAEKVAAQLPSDLATLWMMPA